MAQSSNFLPIAVAVGFGVLTYSNWGAVRNMAASAGIDLSVIGRVLPGMKLDPDAKDQIDDRRRGGPSGDLADQVDPSDADFRGGGGFGRGGFPGGRYAGPPSMPGGGRDDDYQGRQGDPPGRPPMSPCGDAQEGPGAPPPRRQGRHNWQPWPAPYGNCEANELGAGRCRRGPGWQVPNVSRRPGEPY